jgi:hypothetical protein
MAASWQESEIIEGLFVGDLQDAQKFGHWFSLKV